MKIFKLLNGRENIGTSKNSKFFTVRKSVYNLKGHHVGDVEIIDEEFLQLGNRNNRTV